MASGFEILPAIDLRGGRVVRLEQGDFARETAFSNDPVAVAQRFVDAGARWLHVVDLDGARSGVPVHGAVIRRLMVAMGDRVQVEVAGGLRDHKSVADIARGGGRPCRDRDRRPARPGIRRSPGRRPRSGAGRRGDRRARRAGRRPGLGHRRGRGRPGRGRPTPPRCRRDDVRGDGHRAGRASGGPGSRALRAARAPRVAARSSPRPGSRRSSTSKRSGTWAAPGPSSVGPCTTAASTSPRPCQPEIRRRAAGLVPAGVAAGRLGELLVLGDDLVGDVRGHVLVVIERGRERAAPVRQ